MREEKSIMDRKPMATIISPVYNAQAYLEKCLDSARCCHVNIELIQRGLRVVVPQAAEKDAANVLQRAQEYMNGIKLMNEAIVDNITDRNKKILKKLTKKG